MFASNSSVSSTELWRNQHLKGETFPQLLWAIISICPCSKVFRPHDVHTGDITMSRQCVYVCAAPGINSKSVFHTFQLTSIT